MSAEGHAAGEGISIPATLQIRLWLITVTEEPLCQRQPCQKRPNSIVCSSGLVYTSQVWSRAQAGRKGPLVPRTDTAFIKSGRRGLGTEETGSHPVSTFRAGCLGRRAVSPNLLAFCFHLQESHPPSFGSLNGWASPRPPAETCQPTHAAGIQEGGGVGREQGTHLAFPASLSHSGRRGLGQGHVAGLWNFRSQEPRGWSRGLLRQCQVQG